MWRRVALFLAFCSCLLVSCDSGSLREPWAQAVQDSKLQRLRLEGFHYRNLPRLPATLNVLELPYLTSDGTDPLIAIELPDSLHSLDITWSDFDDLSALPTNLQFLAIGSRKFDLDSLQKLSDFSKLEALALVSTGFPDTNAAANYDFPPFIRDLFIDVSESYARPFVELPSGLACFSAPNLKQLPDSLGLPPSMQRLELRTLDAINALPRFLSHLEIASYPESTRPFDFSDTPYLDHLKVPSVQTIVSENRAEYICTLSSLSISSANTGKLKEILAETRREKDCSLESIEIGVLKEGNMATLAGSWPRNIKSLKVGFLTEENLESLPKGLTSLAVQYSSVDRVDLSNQQGLRYLSLRGSSIRYIDHFPLSLEVLDLERATIAEPPPFVILERLENINTVNIAFASANLLALLNFDSLRYVDVSYADLRDISDLVQEVQTIAIDQGQLRSIDSIPDTLKTLIVRSKTDMTYSGCGLGELR